jgi:hypothetical protein
MSVFTITLNDQTFAHKAAECDHIARALELAAAELVRNRGNVTSGSILGQHPTTGAANTSLGSWTYTPSASVP